MQQNNGKMFRPQQQSPKRDTLAGYQVVTEYTGIRRYPQPGEMYLFVPYGTFGTATKNSRFFGKPTDYAIFTIACQSPEELTKVFSI